MARTGGVSPIDSAIVALITREGSSALEGEVPKNAESDCCRDCVSERRFVEYLPLSLFECEILVVAIGRSKETLCLLWSVIDFRCLSLIAGREVLGGTRGVDDIECDLLLGATLVSAPSTSIDTGRGGGGTSFIPPLCENPRTGMVCVWLPYL